MLRATRLAAAGAQAVAQNTPLVALNVRNNPKAEIHEYILSNWRIVEVGAIKA